MVIQAKLSHGLTLMKKCQKSLSAISESDKENFFSPAILYLLERCGTVHCHAHHGLSTLRDILNQVLDTEDITVVLKLCLLLYVDDPTILSEWESELRAELHAVHLCSMPSRWPTTFWHSLT